MKFTSTLVACGAFLVLAGSAHANLLTNGDFDTVDSTPGVNFAGNNLDQIGTPGFQQWNTFNSLPGWTVAAGTSPIEVQTSGTVVNAQSGNNYVELESHPGAPNSTIYQTLNLGPGTYKFSFYYQPRTGSTGDNIVNAFFGDFSDVLTIINGPNAEAPNGSWTFFSFLVNVGSAGSYKVGFNANGSYLNTLGGFVDTASVTAVPVPAALPLLVTGVAGLGYLGRRRRKANATA